MRMDHLPLRLTVRTNRSQQTAPGM